MAVKTTCRHHYLSRPRWEERSEDYVMCGNEVLPDSIMCLDHSWFFKGARRTKYVQIVSNRFDEPSPVTLAQAKRFRRVNRKIRLALAVSHVETAVQSWLLDNWPQDELARVLAENEHTSPCILDRIVNLDDGRWFTKRVALSHPNVDSETLRGVMEWLPEKDMEEPQYRSIAAAVACSPNIPPDVLATCGRTFHRSVVPVAKLLLSNPLTPLSTGETLLNKKPSWALDIVESVSRLDAELLRKIYCGIGQAAVPDKLRYAVVKHPRCNIATLEAAVHDPAPAVRSAVAHHLSCPENASALLADDTEHEVRLAVARSKQTPKSVLMLLALDGSDPRIQHIATCALDSRRCDPAAVF